MKPFYEPGKYVAEVLNQGFSEAKTGTTQFVLRFRVLGHPNPDDPNSYLTGTQQGERTMFRAITENTVKYFIEDLKTLGFTGNSFRLLDPNTPGYHDFTGV